MPKQRKPQDATMRNVRAANKKIERLKVKLYHMRNHQTLIWNLKYKVEKLEETQVVLLKRVMKLEKRK